MTRTSRTNRYEYALGVYTLAYKAEESGDIDKAISEYVIAARLNFVPAQINLGNIYGNSLLHFDRKLALYWYKKAVGLGSSDAARNLALFHHNTGSKRWDKYWRMRARELRHLEREGCIFSSRLKPEAEN